MARNLFRAVGDEIVGLGLETVGEESLTGVGQVLVDASLTITDNERVKRFVAGIIKLLPDAFRNQIPRAARWNLALLKTALKKYAHRGLHHLNAPEATVRLVVDTIDDTVEILQSHAERQLTNEAIDAYVQSAVDAQTPTPAADPAAAGAPMPPTPPAAAPAAPDFKLDDAAYVLGAAPADAIAGLNNIGFERWGRLVRQLRDSDAGDPDDEIPGSQIILEALRLPFAANAPAAKAVLERNVPLEEDAREDLAVLAFFGLIDIYLTDVSFRARFEAAKDNFFTGKTKKKVEAVVTAAGCGLVLLFVAVVALTVVLFVGGAAMFVAGVVMFAQKDMPYVIPLFGAGSACILVGCIFLAGIGWTVKVAEAPFILAKDTFLAVIEAFKTRIHSPTE